MELALDDDFSVALTQDEFAQNLKPLPATPQSRAARRKMLSLKDKQKFTSAQAWRIVLARDGLVARFMCAVSSHRLPSEFAAR